MKFYIPEVILEDIDFSKNNNYEILNDSEEYLLVTQKISDSELIFCNTLYQKQKNGEYEKLKVIADISDNWEFNITEQRYNVLDEKFGLVETERTMSTICYSKDDTKNLTILPFSKNVFSILEMLEKQNIPQLYNISEGYWRLAGDYGVDAITTGQDSYTIPSSQPSLNMVIEKINNKNK